jgi:hypothetical protein
MTISFKANLNLYPQASRADYYFTSDTKDNNEAKIRFCKEFSQKTANFPDVEVCPFKYYPELKDIIEFSILRKSSPEDAGFWAKIKYHLDSLNLPRADDFSDAINAKCAGITDYLTLIKESKEPIEPGCEVVSNDFFYVLGKDSENNDIFIISDASDVFELW